MVVRPHMETQAYVEKILAIRDASLKRAGNFDYGANVVPVIDHYRDLKDYADRRAFQSAVEAMLRSDDRELSEYAVTLCLGFVVFRDAV